MFMVGHVGEEVEEESGYSGRVPAGRGTLDGIVTGPKPGFCAPPLCDGHFDSIIRTIYTPFRRILCATLRQRERNKGERTAGINWNASSEMSLVSSSLRILARFSATRPLLLCFPLIQANDSFKCLRTFVNLYLSK